LVRIGLGFYWFVKKIPSCSFLVFLRSLETVILMLEKSLPEYLQLERIIKNAPKGLLRVESLGEVSVQKTTFPLLGLVIGSPSNEVPVFGLFGGVHGIERIGSQITLSFLESLIEQCHWDMDLVQKLEKIKLISIPMVNPGGIALGRRSNPNGVDLMRNAPVQADSDVTFLVGGHRISPKIPWYRGKKNSPMEIESQALIDFVVKESFSNPFLLMLDVHSGFGMRDRIWYPYARTKSTFPREKEVKDLFNLLNKSQPYHVYRFENQSDNYLTHGDLWDYLFDEHLLKFNPHKSFPVFLPLTLEIGSWLWIRKNPRQLFSLSGIFNPILPHRQNRILRRHVSVIDFFLRASRHYSQWLNSDTIGHSIAL